MSKKKSKNPDGSYVIFFDELIDTATNESVDPNKFGHEVMSDMFNSAPSVPLKKKRGNATHVVHTPMWYDWYFHVGVG